MKFFAVIAFAVAMVVSAATPALADNAQQSRMKECNAKAKGKAGTARKDFMKSCLSGAPAATPGMSKTGKPLTAQQQKMKDCNAQAKGMKGADRKKFMSGCLKKK
ncbi:MAG: PsiF family protein [Thiobacillaceae bacterium]